MLLQTAWADPLRACYGDWQPYIYKNDRNELVGIAKDLLTAAVEAIGQEIEYVRLPYKRCILEVRSGRLDIVMLTSPAISTDLIESRTIFAYWRPAAIVRNQDALTHFSTLKQLSDRVVIVIDSYKYPEPLRRWLEGHATVVKASYGSEQVQGYTVPYRMLEAGRGDVFIEDLFWSHNFIHEYDLDLRVLEPAITCETNSISFRKGLSDLRDKIDHALSVRGTEFREALFMAYTGQPESTFAYAPRAGSRHDTDRRPCGGLKLRY
ncbi:substrate-binding periplasmic protein [Marinobacter fonticola]|uniref:substrate-binding periplasmic protein n=1 Tax=Marinobacter fonticola TaxID=2603215 RepID=UPI00143D2BE3|nr:transporter substrate-binding domain-containing protein [Marinobacter fonticola]